MGPWSGGGGARLTVSMDRPRGSPRHAAGAVRPDASPNQGSISDRSRVFLTSREPPNRPRPKKTPPRRIDPAPRREVTRLQVCGRVTIEASSADIAVRTTDLAEGRANARKEASRRARPSSSVEGERRDPRHFSPGSRPWSGENPAQPSPPVDARARKHDRPTRQKTRALASLDCVSARRPRTLREF